MDPFQVAAMQVAHNYQSDGGDPQTAIDPTQIMAWIEVIKEVIAMIQQCRKAREVPAIASQPSVLEKRLVTNRVRHVLGLREFRRTGRETVEAVMKTGASMSEKEIQELYDAA